MSSVCSVNELSTVGTIGGGGGGGSRMSHVNFKKSLSLIFLNVTCRIKEMNMSHVTTILAPMSHITKPYVTCRHMSDLRNTHVTLSILRVKGHTVGEVSGL